MGMGLKILQLSDLHIGEGIKPYSMEEFADHIILAQTGAPDIILVTGDIFDAKAFKSDEYGNLINEAISFFSLLMDKINVEYKISLSKDSILFLPGNHEVNQDKIGLGKDKFSRYREFLNSFYGNIQPYYFEKDLSCLKVFEDEKVMIAGFSSPNYGKDAAGNDDYFGKITATQLNTMGQKIKSIDNYDEYNIVAALHHHFYMIEERDKSYIDRSALRDSELFFRELTKFNVCAILHGHKHETLNRRVNINLDITV